MLSYKMIYRPDDELILFVFDDDNLIWASEDFTEQHAGLAFHAIDQNKKELIKDNPNISELKWPDENNHEKYGNMIFGAEDEDYFIVATSDTTTHIWNPHPDVEHLMTAAEFEGDFWGFMNFPEWLTKDTTDKEIDETLAEQIECLPTDRPWGFNRDHYRFVYALRDLMIDNFAETGEPGWSSEKNFRKEFEAICRSYPFI